MKRAIVISTCDLYSDCWNPLLLSIRQHWPDCPYPIYMITNYKECEDDKVKTIKVGEHLGWGSNTRKALPQIDCDYLLYFQEDFFLSKDVNTEGILKDFDFCESNNVDYLRVMPPYKDKHPFLQNPNYCYDANEIFKFKEHAMNLMAVIWKRSTLLSLCIEGWTGWDYERKVLDYIKTNGITVNKFVVSSSAIGELGLPVMESTGIRKGVWTREGYEYLLANGFEKEASNRKVEGRLLTWCMKQDTNTLLRVPTAILIRIIQWFNKRMG